MAVFEGKKSSNDILNNSSMSDDEVVASDVSLRYLFGLFSVLEKDSVYIFPSFVDLTSGLSDMCSV